MFGYNLAMSKLLRAIPRRISLSLLFSLITALCVWLAIEIDTKQQQQNALAILDSRGITHACEGTPRNEVLFPPLKRSTVTYVHLYQQELDDPELLSALARLTPHDLSISECVIGDDVLTTVSYMNDLQSFGLSGPEIDFRSLYKLRRNRKLERISLQFSEASDDECRVLAEFPTLRHVYLHGTRVSDDGLAMLAELPDLRSLSVSPDYVTADGLDRLLSRHPAMALQFYGPQIINETEWSDLRQRYPHARLHR